MPSSGDVQAEVNEVVGQDLVDFMKQGRFSDRDTKEFVTKMAEANYPSMDALEKLVKLVCCYGPDAGSQDDQVRRLLPITTPILPHVQALAMAHYLVRQFMSDCHHAA